MRDRIKVLSKKNIYNATYFTVEELEVELPNKKRKIYSNVLRNSSLYVFPLTEDNQICLVSQYRLAFDKITLEVPAGFIEKGEEPFFAAQRELREETGIQAKKLEQFTHTQLSGGVVKSDVYFYLARDLAFLQATPDEDEQIELVKIPLEDAVKKVFTGEINDTGSMLGILMLNTLQSENKL